VRRVKLRRTHIFEIHPCSARFVRSVQIVFLSSCGMYRKFPRRGGRECRVCELERRKKTRTEVGVLYRMANM